MPFRSRNRRRANVSKSDGVAPMAVLTELERAVGIWFGSVKALAVRRLGERAVGGHTEALDVDDFD